MSAAASERRASAVRLKAKGLTYAQIAEQLGVSEATIARIFSPRSYETTLRASREAKRRRRGTCERCGATTGYDGRGGTSRFCVPCGSEVVARAMLARRGTGPTNARVIAYLAEPHTFTEIYQHFGLTKGWASGLLDRLRRYGLIHRVSRGVYIATPTAASHPVPSDRTR